MTRRLGWLCGEEVQAHVYMQQCHAFVHCRNNSHPFPAQNPSNADSDSNPIDIPTDTQRYTHTEQQNAAMHRKSACDNARPDRGHVEPQSEARTHPAVANVLLASDQSIHTRRGREHRL